jgi:hypothetical protein
MLGPPIGMIADTVGRTTVWRIFAGVLMAALPVCGFSLNVCIGEKEIGGSGGSLEPLGLFLRTLIPFMCVLWVSY